MIAGVENLCRLDPESGRVGFYAWEFRDESRNLLNAAYDTTLRDGNVVALSKRADTLSDDDRSMET